MPAPATASSLLARRGDATAFDRLTCATHTTRTTAAAILRVGGRQGTDLTFDFHAHPFQHRPHLRGVEFNHLPACEPGWQPDLAKPHPHQTGHGEANGFKHLAHFTVAAFAQHHVVPLVGALAAALVDGIKFRRPCIRRFIFFVVAVSVGVGVVGNGHAFKQALGLFFGQFTQHPHRVFPLDFITRMHQAVGQLAAGGENQQPGGVDVETANRHPFAVFDTRQIVENSDAVARIIGGDNLAIRLVVEHDARQRLVKFQLHQMPVNHHRITGGNTGADGGDNAVHHHPAGRDHDFHVTPRAVPGLREHLVQAFTFDGLFPGQRLGELPGLGFVSPAACFGDFGNQRARPLHIACCGSDTCACAERCFFAATATACARIDIAGGVAVALWVAGRVAW